MKRINIDKPLCIVQWTLLWAAVGTSAIVPAIAPKFIEQNALAWGTSVLGMFIIGGLVVPIIRMHHSFRAFAAMNDRAEQAYKQRTSRQR